MLSLRHHSDEPRTLPHGFLLLVGVCLWCLPAIAALADQTWQTEAGSLSPIVMGLGIWTLWHVTNTSELAYTPVPASLSVLAIAALLPLHLFAAAVDMAALVALTAWAGGCLAFLAVQGWARTRTAAFPLLFIGLVIPLPYSLSLPLTLRLREEIADRSTDLAVVMGMDVALDGHTIIVGGYELAVDAACAGMNSMLSLAAIGLLFAFWSRERGWLHIVAISLSSVPIALSANVLRVVALMLLTRVTGPDVLATFWHPLAGVISFCLALAMLWVVDRSLVWGRSLRPIIHAQPT